MNALNVTYNQYKKAFICAIAQLSTIKLLSTRVVSVGLCVGAVCPPVGFVYESMYSHGGQWSPWKLPNNFFEFAQN